METEVRSLGSSLLVPCVQELAKQAKDTIPPRYVQTDQDPPVISYRDNAGSPDIPFIDMEHLFSQDQIRMDLEFKKLDSACKEWGFFQLINHGVSSSLIEKVKVGIQDFFNLPMEEKKNFWQRPNEVEGFGQAFVVSEEQKLDWADIFFLATLPVKYRKSHLFPNLPLPFRDTLEDYAAELKALAVKITEFLAKALKMRAEEMRELFENGTQSMRMNYYPPCSQPERVIGLTPHSDSTGLTILLQVNEMEGLQIKKDGFWVPVKPLPNAFVVNIGDILEIVTNGTYRSIEHRAAVNSAKERLSVATFYNPNLEGIIGPAPSLITPTTPPKFRKIGCEDYFKAFFARKLEGKSYLDVMRIEYDENNTNTSF